jgi:hypothetical protein
MLLCKYRNRSGNAGVKLNAINSSVFEFQQMDTIVCVSKFDNKWHNQTHRNANNDLVNSNQCSANKRFVTAKQTI